MSESNPLTSTLDAIAAARARIAAAPATTPHAEMTLGFAFKPGDRVIDVVTGHEGVIDAGHQITRLDAAAKPHLD